VSNLSERQEGTLAARPISLLSGRSFPVLPIFNSLLVFTGNIDKTPHDAAFNEDLVAAQRPFWRFSLFISLLAGNSVAETRST